MVERRDEAGPQRAGFVYSLRRSPFIRQAGERRSARIESLRALAALGVVVDHAWLVAAIPSLQSFPERVIRGGGTLGVGVFFALTGYLIFLPFARRDFGSGRPVRLGGYFLNRGLRILPLYYVVLIVVALADGLSLHTVGRYAWFGEGFSEHTVAQGPLGAMWTLVVELQFYVLLPLLAWVLLRLARGSAVLAAALLILMAAASIAVFEATFLPFQVWLHSLPVNFYRFVPGMLIALGRAHREGAAKAPVRDRSLRADVLLGTGVLVWLAIFLDPGLEFRLAPLSALGALFVVGAVVLTEGQQVRDGGVARVLNWRPLAALGVASYSLYLWHYPLMLWLPRMSPGGYLHWLVFLGYAFAVAAVLAALSYLVIESPPLRLRRRWFAGSPVTEPR